MTRLCYGLTITILPLMCAVLPACTTTAPNHSRTGPDVRNQRDAAMVQSSQTEPKKSIAREAIEILDPRQKAYQEAGSAAASAREKIAQLDVAAYNDAVARVHLLLDELTTSINEVDSAAVNQVVASLQSATDELGDTIRTLNQSLSRMSLEHVDDAVASSENAFDQIGHAAEELQALFKEARQVVSALQAERVARVAEQLESSSLSFQQAMADLPSTSNDLSATIWLLNILIGIGILLGILLLLQRRIQHKHDRVSERPASVE